MNEVDKQLADIKEYIPKLTDTQLRYIKECLKICSNSGEMVQINKRLEKLNEDLH